MKYFLFLAFFLLLPALSKAYASQGQVLIINQVRGEECCDKGNFKNLTIQVNTLIKDKIPAVFTLRYDALKNTKYVSYLKKERKSHPDLINLGILLEVTPNLAHDSGVTYSSSNQDEWFEAQKLFSIGYTNEENIKAADALFKTFYDDFGNYPQVTSSWMINTNLLNYINKQYGVKVHQITREQWGLDSYSLYGGPPQYPYPASASWALMPDYNRENAPLIVRQTIADPLYNYGDSTSSFTSQPNDYLRNKHFGYFENLTTQALTKQNGTGFAVLGLETSMEEKYQDEYSLQIDFLQKLRQEKSISFPNISDLYSFWEKQKISLYQGEDLIGKAPNKAFYITTPNYRVRLLKEGNSLSITDIRLFNSTFSDPYSDTKALRDGFWIVPFVLDGSLRNKSKSISLINSQPVPINNFISVNNDINSDGAKIELPSIKDDTQLKIVNSNNQLDIGYQTRQGKNVQLKLGSKSISTIGLTSDDFNYKDNTPSNYPISYSSSKQGFKLSWNINKKTFVDLSASCKTSSCQLDFDSNPGLINSVRKYDYEYLLPQPAGHPIDNAKTILYANNKYAIAGRNPVRIIVIPNDKYGIVTTLPNSRVGIDTEPSLKSVYIPQGKRYFIDFYSDEPTFAKISLSLGDGVVKKQDVYFAPNCKSNVKVCLTNPKYLWWYLNTIVGDKTRQFLYKEKQ